MTYSKLLSNEDNIVSLSTLLSTEDRIVTLLILLSTEDSIVIINIHWHCYLRRQCYDFINIAIYSFVAFLFNVAI